MTGPLHMGSAATTLTVSYKNHRGEIATRTISPRSIQFTSTEFHQAPQWIMHAYDHEKQALRSFAMKDFLAVLKEERLTTNG